MAESYDVIFRENISNKSVYQKYTQTNIYARKLNYNNMDSSRIMIFQD